jgi:SAM-dependent methyltransferase
VTIADSYDAAARAYAMHLAGELAHKPLDRELLERFADQTRPGAIADLGCGPGHVARYLADRGAHVIAIDLSPRMIDIARELHPGLEARVGDMTALDLPDASLAGAVLFYAIVHTAPEVLSFRELRRVLVPGGLALVAFHVGTERVHVDELFGVPVDLDFQFHEPAVVAAALARDGLPVIEHTVREPYPDVEYPSRRAYLLSRAR